MECAPSGYWWGDGEEPLSFMSTPNLNAGSVERDWDPDAALRRLAGGDTESLKARLRQAAQAYAQAPREHLSFEAMQDVVAGDPRALDKYSQHLDVCEYCAGLREAMSPTPAGERAFGELVQNYERPPHVPTQPKAVRRPFFGGLSEWAAMAAGVALLGFTFMMGSYQGRHAVRGGAVPVLTQQAPVHEDVVRIQVPDIQTDWKNVSAGCTQQSGQKQGCDLLASAAQLQLASLHGASQPAVPIVVAALERSGVSAPVVTHVEGVLATPPPPSADTHGRLQALEDSLTARPKDPALYLELARLRFANGEPVKGFESLSSYVSADNPAAGKALLLGFVEPLKTAQAHRPRTYDLTPEHGGPGKPTLSPVQKYDSVLIAIGDDGAKSDPNSATSD